MKKRMFAVGLLCSATLLASTGTLHAQISSQDDHLIENQRDVVIDDTTWGDTYVGRYTPGNGLIVTSNATLESDAAYVGFTDSASSNTAWITSGGSWSMDSLQIGTASNSQNTVTISAGGEIQISGDLTILGTNNGNALFLNDGGTLFMESDFDAMTAGFNFGPNSTLKVGGSLSNLEEIDGSHHLVLDGPESHWQLMTNTLNIGASTDGNSVTLDNGATFTVDNLMLGAAGTTSNLFNLGSDAFAEIQSNLVVAGTDNYVSVDGGILQVNQNLNSENAAQLGGNGEIWAFGNVQDLPGLDGSGSMFLSGANARWTNNANIQIGAITSGTALIIESNALVRADSIAIGGASSSGNEVVMQHGGKLVLDGVGSVLYDNNAIRVEDGGWITFGSDFSSALTWTNSNIYWQSGGTFEFQGEAPVIPGWFVEDPGGGSYYEDGTLFLGMGRTMILNGPSAYLNAYTNNFHLGDLSSDNTFVVSNGAWAAFQTVSIGDFKEGGNDNLLLVSGNGSTVTNLGFTAIGGTLIGGMWHEGGNHNILRVEDGGLFYSPDMLHNQNSTGTSGLEIASGGMVDVDSYYQNAGAYLTILTDSTGTNAGLLRANTAEFEAGARVGVDAVERLQIDQLYTNTIVEAGSLIIDGVTNGTTADLAKLGASGGTLVNYNLSMENGTNIVATYRRRYLSEAAGFNTETMLAEISSEIESLAANSNSAAINQLNIINNLGSEQAVNQQMTQLYAYQLPTYEHSQGLIGGIDQVRARGMAFHGANGSSALPRPNGVNGPGPHSADQGPQGWVKAYGGFGTRDNDNFDDGYDVQTYGTVIGFDQTFDEWLFGIGGGYAGTTIDGDNDDESDATTAYGLLYASYGTKDWFGDLVLSYGQSDIDIDSGTVFGVSANTDASQTAFYIGGGKEFKDPEGSDALLRPLLALQVSQYDQDAYTEKSTMAVAKDVDAFDRWSYQTTFGAEMVLPTRGATIDWETQLRLYWLHEFNDDTEEVDYTLVGSSQPGRFVMRAPESDIAQLGIGCVAQLENGLQLRADLDSQISDDFFATTLSGALLYEF